MARQGHPVSHSKVGQLLHGLDYSLQSNRKTEEGQDHPDRDAQFRHIAVAVKRCLAKGSPVISVDTKKKELIGNYANAGQQWRPAKQPTPVQGHDFPTPDVPRAFPYGIYDIGRNTGFVNVGTDHDTGAFAVASIRGLEPGFPIWSWYSPPQNRRRALIFLGSDARNPARTGDTLTKKDAGRERCPRNVVGDAPPDGFQPARRSSPRRDHGDRGCRPERRLVGV